MATGIVNQNQSTFLQEFFNRHNQIPERELRKAIAIYTLATKKTIYNWTYQKTPPLVENALTTAERLAIAEKRPLTKVLKGI